MAQNNWTLSSFFPAQWTDASDWSLGLPISSQDAYIGTNSGFAVVQSAFNETVNSIATSSDDDLDLIGGSTFTATAGTRENVNSGAIGLNDAVLNMGGGSIVTFDNGSTGSIVLNGASSPSYSPAIIMIAGAGVELTGSGSIMMTIGNSAALNLIEGNTSLIAPTLVNQGEDISGTGTILDVNFINYATVETNNNTSSSGGILTIQLSGSFINAGAVQADNGGTLIFGSDGVSSSLTNGGTISLLGSIADTYMQIAGDVTINSSATGVIEMGGSVPSLDFIASDGHAAELTLVGGTLNGVGTVGDANLTLDNVSATIDATDGNLYLHTGSNTITNGGTLEGTDDGVVEIESPVNNSGTIVAEDTGQVAILAAVSGPGTVEIGPNGFLEVLTEFSGLVFRTGSVAGNVQFNGPGLLVLNEGAPNGGISGEILGAAAGDRFFIEAFNFVAGEHAVWQQTSGSGGTLSLYSDGTDLYALNLAGQYTSLNFTVESFSLGGSFYSAITVQNTPTYAENPGNTDEWILSDGNWAASAGPGPGPTDPSGNPYQVAGTGDWTGNGTDGILWFDSTTGDVNEWQLANTQWAAGPDLGSHPANSTDGASYQIAGTDASTDFTGNGRDDVLWTSTNSNGTIATDIWELNSSGQWMRKREPRQPPGRLFSRRHWRLDRRRHRWNSVAQCINRRHRRVAIVRRHVVSQR